MTGTTRVALITGAARGIGQTIALALAQPDLMLYINDVTPPEAAAETIREVEARGAKGSYLQFNVADLSQVEQAVEGIIKESGRLDILVNNAGITRDQLLVRMKEEDWDQVLAVNLKGAFHCTKTALRHLLKRKGGKIVNIASVTGQMGNAGQSNYAASKAGLIGFTKSVAREYASRNIQVNAVAPGFIDTAMSQAIPQKEREMLLKLIPMERLGTAEDIS